ncbi:MAG: TonB C-terminal domain-containing protein [Gemmatimonadota bacterium]|nr:TonB C-terminal domain-containing protein [Gemmatimonadota bacterium]HEU4989029.1 TonB C-terminal domain-containing protein [Gemmatimonadaceae bacterium]
MTAHTPPRPTLTLPIGASVLLHAAVLSALLLFRPPPPAALPPVYRVQLIAAPAGPRAIGVVRETPATPQPIDKVTPPPKPKSVPKTVPVAPKKVEKTAHKPDTKPKAATPAPAETKTKRVTSKTPTAGGGPEGGRGADVANVSTPGIDFPFPGYVENITRQVALRFQPPGNSTLSAQVVFLIHRDGSVSDFRFQKRSGSYAFDLAAQGAIDAAGTSHAFGPLPSGYPDDVLPVIFNFDPRIIH